MIKFIASAYYTYKIKELHIIKETEKRVWTANSSIRKETKHGRVFDTFEAAKEWLLERAIDDVDSARRRLEQAKGRLGNVKGLRR